MMSKAVQLLKAALTGRARRAHEIVAAEVTTIALCRRGKNRIRPVLKADGAFELSTLAKASDDGGTVLAVVYAPNRLDDDREFAGEAQIRQMAHRYLRDHRQLDIEHDGEVLAKSEAYVAESFIVGQGDERFKDWVGYDGKPVGDLTGAWAVNIQLEHPVLRKAWAEGELDGVSLFGRAAVREVDVTKAAEEIEMDETKLKEILSGFKAEITTMVKSTIAEALPKPPEKRESPKPDADPAPVFEGDITSAEALKSYASKVQAWELRQKMAKGELTAAQVIEMAKSVAEGEPSDKDAGVEEGDSAEVKSLKRQLFKARKRTNAPAPSDEITDDDAALVAEGKEIANAYNERYANANPLFRVTSRHG